MAEDADKIYRVRAMPEEPPITNCRTMRFSPFQKSFVLATSLDPENVERLEALVIRCCHCRTHGSGLTAMFPEPVLQKYSASALNS